MRKLRIAGVVCAITLFGVSAAIAKTFEVKNGESIQGAVVSAEAGDTIKVYPGTYKETVYIDKNNITISGVVVKGEWPLMDGEDILNDGILVAGHGVTVDHFRIRRFKGNGIMTQGANNFTITNNVVEGDSVYGIFPQFGNNGIVSDNIVWNVHDAAIYVGMSKNVDIVRNDVFGSVMGIEIENSDNILVEHNTVHDNASGIQVTLLQGLPVKSSNNTIVRYNFVANNNLANFAPKGSAAAGTPGGTGIVISAADDTYIEGNIISGNNSLAILLADHDSSPSLRDPEMDPTPDNVHIYQNTYWNNGNKPMESVKDFLDAQNIDHGFEVLLATKSKGGCITDRASIRELGTDMFTDCPKGATTAAIKTMQLAKLVEPDAEQALYKGRFAYKAVCTGCHAMNNRLVGPPMAAIKAIYNGRPEALAQWIANPTDNREDYPEMPPQNYLSEDIRLAIANYILTDLGNWKPVRQSRAAAAAKK